MKISRRGATANHGIKSVELKKLRLRWNPTTQTFDLSSTVPATDFSTEARHNYVLKFNPDEISKLLTDLGVECQSVDSEDFVLVFGSAVPALLRTMARASAVI